MDTKHNAKKVLIKGQVLKIRTVLETVQGLPDLLCYFSPLELHGNQLVGGHYWFSIIPPRFPTNKGVR